MSNLLMPSVRPQVNISAARFLNPILMSCMIGNLLQWYDFVIYSCLSAVLGSAFFSTIDIEHQILASWAVFWAGFLARPMGSILFGHIGDKISRKFSLSLSIYAMAIPTVLMGCLPTYEQIGILSSYLLILLRFLQGFAMGGESTGSLVFLIEHAPKGNRGLWGSWATFSSVLGVIIGTAAIAILNMYFSEIEIRAWAWRLPFLLSLLGLSVGAYIRSQLTDPEIYLKEKINKNVVPLKKVFHQYKGKILLIFLLNFFTAVGFLIVTIFLVNYYKTYLNVSQNSALWINSICMLVFACTILLGGTLSDRIGRRKMLCISCLGFILFSYPLFSIMQSGQLHILLMSHIILAVMTGIFFGSVPAASAEIMPTEVRFSGLSIAHNLSMAIVGGGVPFIATRLIQQTGDLCSPAYLMMFTAFVSLVSLIWIKDRQSLSFSDMIHS